MGMLKQGILEQLIRTILVFELDNDCFKTTINLTLQVLNQISKLLKFIESQKMKIEAERQLSKFLQKRKARLKARKEESKKGGEEENNQKTEQNRSNTESPESMDNNILASDGL